mgnify:CR=1 FL=1
MIYYWDIIGTFFFCLSGALAGRQKDMDWWGVFVIALVTGTGGGTLRSIMIGDLPPPVFRDPHYVIIAAIATPCAMLIPSWWEKFRREVSVMDAIGLGVFVCLGTHIAMDHGLAWWAAIGMGVVTATFGGVTRDILRAEIPLVFRREIYATAALAGGLLLVGLEWLGMEKHLSILIAAACTAGIRLLAIRYAINHSK